MVHFLGASNVYKLWEMCEYLENFEGFLFTSYSFMIAKTEYKHNI